MLLAFFARSYLVHSYPIRATLCGYALTRDAQMLANKHSYKLAGLLFGEISMSNLEKELIFLFNYLRCADF